MEDQVSFEAVINKRGINPYISVPEDVSTFFGRGNIPVKGKINSFPIIATLVPVKPQGHILYVNGEMRSMAKVGVGDRIKVVLERDRQNRDLPIPEKLKEALANNPTAKEAWEKLPPSHKKEFLSYLNFLKSPESLERNVEKIVKILLEK
jgi:hypothetical protein